MATARDTICMALRLIGALASGEDAAAAEAGDGLAAFNRMLHGWKARGVDLGHADLGLSDPLPLAPEFHEGAAQLLALRLAAEYERDLRPELVLAAADSWAAIRMAHATPGALTIDGGLLRMPGARRGAGSA